MRAERLRCALGLEKFNLLSINHKAVGPHAEAVFLSVSTWP